MRRTAILALAAPSFALGGYLQASRAVNHDVDWLLLATNRLLAGASMYVDGVVEYNSPIVFYVLAPPVAVARAFDLSEIGCVRFYVAILIAACIWFANRLLAALFEDRELPIRGLFVAVLGFALWIPVYPHFAQREHLMTILLLPYLIVVAVRARRLAVASPDAIVAGLAAGVCIAIKPHYLLALVGTELSLVWRFRDVGACRRTEVAAIVGVCLVYLISTAVIFPEYFGTVLPLARDTYWAFQSPRASLLRASDLILLSMAGAAAAATAKGSPRRDLARTLFIAAAATYAARLVQATAWEYLSIPFQTFSLLAIPLAIDWKPRNTMFAWARSVLALVVLVYWHWALPVGVRWTLANGSGWRAGIVQGEAGAFARLIRTQAPGGSVYFFSTSLGPAFPALRYAGASWSSRFPCLWPLPAIVRSRAGVDDGGAPDPSRIDAIERYLLDAVVGDFERSKPDLVFVDLARRKPFMRGIDFGHLEYFGRDSRFVDIWSQYEFIGQFGGYGVHRRKAGASPPPAGGGS